jgi:hypothetical protein
MLGLFSICCVALVAAGLFITPTSTSGTAPSPIISTTLAAAENATPALEPTGVPEPIAAPTAPEPTVALSVTSEPTPVPPELPTAVPSPTKRPATPLPTDIPAQSAGLGVSRAQVQRVYEKAGFTFNDAPDIDGQPRVIGSNPMSQSIELIGPRPSLPRVNWR